MIRLHYTHTSGGVTSTLLDPSKIVGAQRAPHPDDNREVTEVFTVEAAEPGWADETPEDIARLKYAWANRHDGVDEGLIAIELVDGAIKPTYADLSIDEDR